MDKPIRYQHELTEELEARSRPSWYLGNIRQPAIDQAKEAELQKRVADMQGEFDIA
jgi:hypothetical protein